MDPLDASVILALRKSPKGLLKYDRYFEEENRMKEVLDDISSNLTKLHVSPVLSQMSPHVSPIIPKENKNDSIVRNRLPEKKRLSFNSDILIYEYEDRGNELEILEYERERIKSAQALFKKKQEEYDDHKNQLLQQIEVQYLNVKKEPILIDASSFESELKKLQDTHMKNLMKIRQIDLPKSVELEKPKEIEIKPVLTNGEIQKEKEQVRDLREDFEIFKKQKLATTMMQIADLMQTCDRMHLKTSYVDYVSQVSATMVEVNSIVTMAKSGPVTTETMAMAHSLFSKIEQLHSTISEDADQARKKALEEFNLKQAQTPPVRKQVTSTPLDSNKQIQKPVNQISIDVKKDVLQQYFKVVQRLRNLEESLKEFKTNPKHKKYRMELHKAVAINTISGASGWQLKSKIFHLVTLLAGQPVESGGKYVSCKNHPDAVKYCKNLLAEKIVSQSETQVLENKQAAFLFGAVTVSLCSKFPDLWPLILGHFYVRCPYLVPYYPPREKGQSDVEYYITLGYKYENNKLEDVTNFLKRMNGFGVLYAAIIESDMPPGFEAHHSETIGFGWTWMARTLNMEPLPDITATMILAFLEIIGYMLMEHYGQQFKKILHILSKEFFSKIKQVSETGGPSGRLEEFLHNFIAKGSVAKPKERLSHYFWKT